MTKRALVTGSTRGIGKQIANDLLRKGINVILNYALSDIDAKNTTNELSRISVDFSVIKADLSSFEVLDGFISEVKRKTKTLDYLILNAGATAKQPFEYITIEDWTKVFNTNLSVPFFIVQKLSDIIRDDGRIIFIGSLLGLTPHAVSIPYGVSKSCLGMLAKYLAKVFASRRITVNVVAPGFIDTSWQQDKEKEQRSRIENRISLKRFAKPEEISSTCMHIMENGYINGQTILVDGGYDYE